MTNTICGHDRNDLLVWLRAANEIPGITPAIGCECRACLVRNAVLDPVKLAEMMAEELQRFGCVLPPPRINNHPEPECPNGGYRVKGLAPLGLKPRIDIEWRLPAGRGRCVLFMPQARAIHLQWVQLPDGARDEAEQVLRGAP